MKPSRSVNSLLTNGGQQNQAQMVSVSTRRQQPPEPPRTLQQIGANQSNASTPTSPICRCRVMYLGSSVPHITKDGLQGIQEPLRELYPDEASLASGNAGIDSWLSVWSNGILIENVDETGREVKRFFKIEALHYCAAVKYVSLANSSTSNNLPRFLPLDSPHARTQATNSEPPIFASILRRTTGVKVLECHAFICKREAAANALVRCCFHAYADTMYAKQIGADIDSVTSTNADQATRPNGQSQTLQAAGARRSKSTAALSNDLNGDCGDSNNNYINSSDSYHGNQPNSMLRRKSMNENDETSDNSLTNLRKHYQLSKSMHQLNRADQPASNAIEYASQMGSHSTSIHNLATSKARWNQPIEQSEQPNFYNPYASRVPSYPPQNLIDQQQRLQQQQQQQHRHLNNGGTLRSIKSMTANSIASTLLRSKKRTKTTSAVQMGQQEFGRLPGFHQPHMNGSATLAPSQSFMMPPVPPMFLPRLPIVSGSQTMKLPRQQQTLAPYPQFNFEAMTPKEMKKLLKKSAKYGIDPGKFGAENNAPPLPMFAPMQPPMPCHIPPVPSSLHSNKSGTINSQSAHSMDQQLQGAGQDMADYATGLPPAPPNFCPPPPGPIKSILVKPNPEFLKSKAGKKWLKQQKEFKKLLPPHLDGLPIVFGPPPMDALEPAPNPMNESAGIGLAPPPAFLQSAPHPGLPLMDTNGYYSQAAQSMYLLPSGRASTASTLLRYSPQQHALDSHDPYSIAQRGHSLYGPPVPNMIVMPPPPPPMRDSMSGLMNSDNAGLLYDSHLSGTLGSNTKHCLFNGSDPTRRRHMIEQSVISLGDENEGEDEEGDEDHAQAAHCNGNNNDLADDVDDDGPMNGYYNRVAESSSSQRLYRDDQQNYEQVLPPEPPPPQAQMLSNDDQSSYSSGIYRRGHMNERAFSYSIRQEHKSGSRTNADCSEYANPNGKYNNQQQVGVYDNPQHQIYHAENGNSSQYRNGSNISRRVDELSARLENQLDMRSFVSSARVRSHM